MGLDQYLYAEKYVSGYEHGGPEKKKEYDDLVELANAREYVDPKTPSGRIVLTVAYWRKANQIHAWFVRNCQDGADDCQRADVEREQLEELLLICEEVLNGAANAEEALPPQAGFFFGSTEIDEGYEYDLQQTIEMLTRALKMPVSEWEFAYQSSW